MFILFFYLLRARGMNPSVHQWMTLMEALDRDMANSSLAQFYNLCRCILVSSEADFDKFDEVFLEFFEQVSERNKIPEERAARSKDDTMGDFMDWLNNPSVPPEIWYSPEHMEILRRIDELLDRMLKKMHELVGRGGFSPVGSCAVCTGCGACARGMTFKEPTSAGQPEEEPQKIQDEDALRLARERRFRDFRVDTVLDIRQFQMAFRRLRRVSSRLELPETELDIDQTIDKTAKNGGLLKIAFRKPRKNSIKLLVLFDSDGSMQSYQELANRLFQALDKANHFKDLQFFYFHNCIYDHLYKSPLLIKGDWMDTKAVMRNYGGDYKVIFVGDASMADSELFAIGGNVLIERSNYLPGVQWLERLKRFYHKTVWLNPIPKSDWNRLYGGRTIQVVGKLFPMYELTTKGLESAIRHLMAG